MVITFVLSGTLSTRGTEEEEEEEEDVELALDAEDVDE